MRKKTMLVLLLTLLLTIAACGSGSSRPEKPEIVLYFLSGSLAAGESGHGPALDWEPYTGGAEPEAQDLMNALLEGPESEMLSTPFPRGVSLRTIGWDEERPGVLSVSLSEQYGALSDISLTLADYCIVLTLSQLEGVEQVEILSGGHSAEYRERQILRAEEALLEEKAILPAPQES